MRRFTILAVLCTVQSLQPRRAELGKGLARRGSHGTEGEEYGGAGFQELKMQQQWAGVAEVEVEVAEVVGGQALGRGCSR